MTHRVFLDFSCQYELLQVNEYASEDVQTDHLLGEFDIERHPDLIDDLLTSLVLNRWEFIEGDASDQAFNEMAAQLPEADLDSFIRNTKVMMYRKGPFAELSIGYFVQARVGRIRLRVRSANDAILTNLGLKLADDILDDIDEMSLMQMELYNERSDVPLMQGEEVSNDPYQFFAVENRPVFVPLLASVGFLIIGFMISLKAWHESWEVRFFGEAIWLWYGRLFGPMLMAVISLSGVVWRDARRSRRKRRALWNVPGAVTDFRERTRS
jgi:hypothetical protein